MSLDPLEEGGDPGEGSWVADLAAEPGPEAGDADLAVLACTVLYSTVLYCVVLYCLVLYCDAALAILAVLVQVLQGAARVPVAGGGAAVPGDADVPDHHGVICA